ncbi:MAG: metal ABC transporter permease [Campylobacter sp.]|nr:metal ABC transporter permease [Campylobacter sp.]
MQELISLSFMQNAFLGGFLVSIACGVIGTLVVINKMSFIAGGIAHGAYGGIGIAIYCGIPVLFGVSVFSVFLSLLVAYITLKDKVRFDSVIGAIWAFGMAVGIVLIDLSPGYNGDLMGYLFGSILMINGELLKFIALLDAVFIVFASFFYAQICASSFDSEFARLRGVKTTLIYYALIVLTGLCVVGTIQIVGLLLVIALLTIPPFIAEKFCKSVASMMVLSTILSVLFCFLGLIISYYFNLTSGACIIMVASITFFGVIAFRAVFKRG